MSIGKTIMFFQVEELKNLKKEIFYFQLVIPACQMLLKI